MKDKNKTKEQLINEVVELRHQVAELEAADTGTSGWRRCFRSQRKKVAAQRLTPGFGKDREGLNETNI